MKLIHWIRYALYYDTTFQGQFTALKPLLLGGRSGSGWVVDVGANDGFYNSNAHPFIKRGWNAILVEPHPHAFALASKRHGHNPRVKLVNMACSDMEGTLPLHLMQDDYGGSRSTLYVPPAGTPDTRPYTNKIDVPVKRLESILELHKVPAEFDLLAVDTDGGDLRVIQGMNLQRYRPKVIITENGADDEAKFTFLRGHGYELKAKLGFDTVWALRKQ